MPTVSVVIPCYNAAEYLAEALASVRAQRRQPDEVIVVDDCSTDGSAEVARRHAGVRVVSTPKNSGESAARNLGARAAAGELIAWLDADDYWADDHLATVVPLLERFPEAVLAFSLVRMFGTRSEEWPRLIPERRPVDAFDACLRRTILPHNTVVVRRAALLAAGGYDERLRVAADYDMWLRLSREHPFVCAHAVTCHWRQHDRNLGGDLFRYWRGEYESRWRLWQSAAASGGADRLAAAMRDVWRGHLLTGWHSRSRAQMAFHLSMRELVPGAEAEYGAWRRRAALLPLAVAWDRVPPGAKRTLKSLVRRAVGRPRDAAAGG